MKKLNEKQKKIINIVITSLQIAVVIIAITLSAIILVNPNIRNNEVGKSGTKLLPVLTDSMKGSNKDSFSKGDLVVARAPKDAAALEEGDIVTFKTSIGGVETLNTHRIINVVTLGDGSVRYTTKGDAAPDNKTEVVLPEEILAVYKYHLKGVGGAIAWLQVPTNFLLVIVLPLIALFVYNIVLFVRMIMQSKLNKVQAEKEALVIDEDEIKRRAVEEYLASQEKKNSD